MSSFKSANQQQNNGGSKGSLGGRLFSFIAGIIEPVKVVHISVAGFTEDLAIFQRAGPVRDDMMRL
jgi:hypothetical protein